MINNFILRSQEVEVNLGVSMMIHVQNVQLEDYGTYGLIIGTAFPPYTGTEPVFLQINGVDYPLIDNAGNIVVAGKLRSGKITSCCNIQSSKYRLQFGSNGMPAAEPHFVVHCGLCPMLYNGTGGSNDNLTPTKIKT